jgi:hypothetical protein
MAGLGFRSGAASIAAVWLFAGAARAADAPKTPTFTKDIAPIFQAKCESCHRPDSMAPMALVTYQDARPWARSIKARVTGHQMPPWHIDKNVGIQEFKNDRSLNETEIDTIARWVDAGAPQGDPKDMPPAIQWPDAAGLELREGVRRTAGSDRQIAVVHNAGARAGCLGQALERLRRRRDRAALGPRD